MKCCFCGNDAGEYGNSAWPLNEEERCCDACNLRYVISARLAIMNNPKDEEKIITKLYEIIKEENQ